MNLLVFQIALTYSALFSLIAASSVRSPAFPNKGSVAYFSLCCTVARDKKVKVFGMRGRAWFNTAFLVAPRFPSSSCCSGTRGTSPRRNTTWQTCSCMQALERIRRSSLRQVEINLAMVAGLAAYFTWGETQTHERRIFPVTHKKKPTCAHKWTKSHRTNGRGQGFNLFGNVSTVCSSAKIQKAVDEEEIYFTEMRHHGSSQKD